MRILIVTSYNNATVAPFISEQVEGLRSMGVECEYYLLQGKGIRGYLHNLPLLKASIGRFRPDVIHAHYGLCGLLSSLQRKVPVVTTFHGSDVNRRELLPLSLLAHWRSAHSIFVSRSLARRCHASVQHSTVLPCGVDTTLFVPLPRDEARRRLYLPMEQPLVLFAGAYADSTKNIGLARAAIRHLSGVRLIELRGYSREETVSLFNAVDLLLVTSHREGSPQVVKEALACNCPVVSVDVGDVRDQLRGVEGCRIVDRNEHSLAQAIRERLDEPMHQYGRQQILDRQLDTLHTVQKLNSIYSSIHARTDRANR